MYFDYHIPLKAPSYFQYGKDRYERIAEKVCERMENLEAALIMSGLQGEQFGEAVRPLFLQKWNGTDEPLIDRMYPEDIADVAMLLGSSISVPKRMEWKNAITVVDTYFVTTKEWEELRRLGLGGSDSACVADYGYSSPREIYYSKVGLPENLSQRDLKAGNEFIFQYGHCVEPLVIDEFCRRYEAKRVRETRMFGHKDYPFLTANIDQIVEWKGKIYVFEAKTTTFFNMKEWLDNNVPVQYLPQCHKYPMVLNDDRICGTFIGCVFGNTPSNFACSFVERDLAAETAQLEQEVEFWNKHIILNALPPISQDPTKDLRLLNRMTERKPDKSIQLRIGPQDHSLQAYVKIKNDRARLTAQIKTLETQMKMLELNIRQMLGDAMAANIQTADGTKYSVSVKIRKGKRSVNYEKMQSLYTDAYNDCVSENTSEILDVKNA